MKLSLTVTRPSSSYPTYTQKHDDIVSTIEAEGDPTMIAGYLRSMADSIDPPPERMTTV